MLLVSGATRTLWRYENPAKLGLLVVPRAGNSPRWLMSTSMYWAADNGAFSKFDAHLYERMLQQWADVPRCLFVTLPDVVGNAVDTLRLWDLWYPMVSLPRKAFVAQDGSEDVEPPWTQMTALFIGGTTDFKMSLAAGELIAEARHRGKWVHVGRVNSFQRLSHFHDLGVDSVDGSSMSMYPDTYIPRFMEHLNAEDRQSKLFTPETGALEVLGGCSSGCDSLAGAKGGPDGVGNSDDGLDEGTASQDRTGQDKLGSV